MSKIGAKKIKKWKMTPADYAIRGGLQKKWKIPHLGGWIGQEWDKIHKKNRFS